MTLIELLVALTVFAVIFSAVSVGIGRSLTVTRNNRNRTAAAYLAGQQLEQVRAKGYGAVDPGLTTCTSTTPPSSCPYPLPPAPYTVKQEVSVVAPGSTLASPCDAPAGSSGTALAYKRVTVTVTWPDMGGVVPPASQTVLAPPLGALDPASGHVAVHLTDRDGDPVVDQTVTLSTTPVSTQRTTGDGCAFFAFLNPGAYTVTMAPAGSGYVDQQGNQPYTASTSVVGGVVSKVDAAIDLAATLTIGLVPPSGSPAAVVPGPIPVTVYSSGLASPGTRAFAGTGLSRTVTPLFPFTGGYQAWAGDCADAEPKTYSGANDGPVLTTNPGGTAAGTVALDAVDITVLDNTNKPAPGRQVRAVHAAATGCTAGETLTSTSAVTDASGKVRLALPYGTWTLSAVTGTKNSANVTLDPVSTAIPQKTVTLS